MPTPRELAASAAPLLVLDAASTRIQVGVVEANGASRWEISEGEAGTALFAAIAVLGTDVSAVGGFVFCAGPGSILGIRTAAMAIRTWCALRPRPVWSYLSLEVLVRAQPPPQPIAIADARRDSWHVFDGRTPLRRMATAELAAGADYCTPEGFRHWTALPREIAPRILPYDLPRLWDALAAEDFLRPSAEPDAFLHEDPSYVTWTPRIHRAPQKA